MKLAVCLKQTLSRESGLRIDEAGAWIREDEASWGMSEPDGYALEAGLRLKDAHGGELVAVSVGPDRVSAVLREGLARGADRAVQIVNEDPAAAADPQIVAAALAHVLREERPDIVLTGLQSDDHGFAQVGVALAECLGAHHATIVVDIELTDTRLRVKRELEGGWFQWIGLPLPAVLTMQTGINQLRYASLRGVMAARRKEIRRATAPASVTVRQRIVSVSAPQRAGHTRMLEGAPAEAAAALAHVLHES